MFSRTGRTLALLATLMMSTVLMLAALLKSADHDSPIYHLFREQQQHPGYPHPSSKVQSAPDKADSLRLQKSRGQHAAANSSGSAVEGPVRHCDMECWRFRKQLQSWPSGKPKAVIYYLSHVPHFLKNSLRFMDLNFNRQFQYPIVVFHERDFRVHFTDIMEIVPDVYFQEITFNLPNFLREPVSENIPCISPISYRHMCRFQAKLVYEEPIMEGLEYYWRLDDDSLINEPIKYDVFQFMRDSDIAYGYTWIHLDSFACTLGLWEAVDKYIKEKHIKPEFFNEWPSPQIYYNNFEISSMVLWQSQEYKDYIEHIDKLGGIYYHRWGDAPIKSIAVSLFVPRDKTHHFKNIGYEHGTYDSRRVHGVS